MVSGDRLIEASSRPTRTYVKFDRNVFRDLIETCARAPNSDRHFLLDRECHLFDMDYLKSRFDASGVSGNLVETSDLRRRTSAVGKGDSRSIPTDSEGGSPAPLSEQEDVYETLADA